MTKERTNPWDALERAILSVLPDEGAKRGKYLPDGKSSRGIVEALDDPEITTMNIGRRLAELDKRGMVVGLSSTSDRKLWQRTAKGKQYLDNGRG